VVIFKTHQNFIKYKILLHWEFRGSPSEFVQTNFSYNIVFMLIISYSKGKCKGELVPVLN